MNIFQGHSFDDIYFDMARAAQWCGENHKPRGLDCLELRPAIFEIRDASLGLYTGVSRKLNYRFYAIETLTYLAGMGGFEMGKLHTKLMIHINPNMQPYINLISGQFDGPYGPAVKAGMVSAFAVLMNDPHSRQACFSIWDSTTPIRFIGSKDMPCTMGFAFGSHIDGSLGLTVTMRSNDLNWGTPYDVAAFCSLQCLMADMLGMQPGRYTHLAASLHVYTKTPPNISSAEHEEWLPFISIPRLEFPAHIPISDRRDMFSMSTDAQVLLLELMTHRGLSDLHQECKSWQTFHSIIEDKEGYASGYWKQWCDIIRFGKNAKKGESE